MREREGEIETASPFTAADIKMRIHENKHHISGRSLDGFKFGDQTKKRQPKIQSRRCNLIKIKSDEDWMPKKVDKTTTVP